MINFYAYTKDADGDYTQAIDGRLVFTFSNSILLDERLNEAYLNVVNSSIPYFEPTTEIKVVVNDGTNEKPYYFIIASDRAQELPNGSGKYKHEIHLLERTKLLEGIYCQSITFTNSQGNVYTKNPLNVRPTQPTTTFPYDSLGVAIEDLTTNLIVSPVPLGETVKTPTPTDMFELLSPYYPQDEYQLLEYWKPNTETDFVYTGVSVENGTDIQSSNGTNAFIEIDAKNPLIITYTLVIATIPISSTFAFKFTYTINAVQNQYPLKPWTITDCVNRCLDLCEPIFNGETPRYRLQGVSYDENGNIVKPYATGSLAEKNDKILAPEFTMTECTLREQLKVIGSYIHCEPRLGGYDEYGEWQDNYIFFDPYDETTEANISISRKPYVYKAYNRDINEYCTHLESSAKNVVNSLNYAQGVVTEPSINGNRTIRTETVNVIISENNAYAPTDNKIYDIPSDKGSVLVTLYGADGGTIFSDVDITPYIFRDTEYNNLSSYEGGYPYTKHYALYYSQGQEGIKGLFYKVENAIDSIFSNYAIVNIVNAVTGGDYKKAITDGFNRLAFKISYVPIYDTKLSHGKSNITLGNTPFMRVFNQSENLIETRSFGENIKAIASKMGNVEQTRTYILKSLEDIPEVSQTIDGFVIVDVKCEFQQSFIKCTVQMTKDFRVNQYVGINSQKRVFEVSELNAYERNILLKNYIVISDKAETVNSSNALLENLIPVLQIFNPNIKNKITNPINAVRSYSYAKSGNDDTAFGKVLLPVISSAFGNAMVFSWDYKDNYSAGTESDTATYKKENTNEDITAYWQKDVAYGDYYGRAYWHKFGLFSNFPIDNAFEQSRTVRDVEDGDIDGDIYTENALLLRKDNRERLSFNYEIEFVTTKDDIIIGSALASSCSLVTAQTSNTAPKVYFYNSKIGKFNKKPPSVYVTYGYVRVTENGVEFDIPNNVEFDSWAIISPTRNKQYTFEDEDGNVTSQYMFEGGEILLARNKSKTQYGNATTETITFQIARTIYN